MGQRRHGGSVVNDSDGVSYWAWGSGDLFEFPAVDLNWYLDAAKKYDAPATAPAGANPAGSGYYPFTGGTLVFNNFVDDQAGGAFGQYSGMDDDGDRAVYYFEDVVRCTGDTFFRADIISVRDSGGSYDFYFEDCPGAVDGYTVTVPEGAQQEYQHADGIAHWNSKGWVEGANTTIDDVLVHGFFYMKGELWNWSGDIWDPNTPTNNMIGILLIEDDQLDKYGDTTIYYDPAIDAAIRYEEVPLTTEYWEEFNPLDWSSPDW